MNIRNKGLYLALVLVGSLFFLLGCGPADEAVQERLGNLPTAQENDPTETPPPSPTPEPTEGTESEGSDETGDEADETASSTPEPTEEPTEEPMPWPTTCIGLPPELLDSTGDDIIERDGTKYWCHVIEPSPTPKYAELPTVYSVMVQRHEEAEAEAGTDLEPPIAWIRVRFSGPGNAKNAYDWIKKSVGDNYQGEVSLLTDYSTIYVELPVDLLPGLGKLAGYKWMDNPYPTKPWRLRGKG